jgi:hypothetical protein
MAEIQQLDKELAELKGFIAELKADRAAQKEKERRESWTMYTSLSLVFIAVLASVASQWSGKYGGTVLVALNNSTYNQALASDQWGYYQAKSIKRNLYEALREVAPKTAEGEGPVAVAAFNAKVAKYKADEAEIMEKAKGLEKERDTARAIATRANKLGGYMGTAVSIFQIAIALGSICLVTKKKPLWYLSMALAVLATAKMIQAWLM